MVKTVGSAIPRALGQGQSTMERAVDQDFTPYCGIDESSCCLKLLRCSFLTIVGYPSKSQNEPFLSSIALLEYFPTATEKQT